MVSPNEILYFIELAQTLNFSRASERIGISQPSLSAAIKRLEQSLQIYLFNRSKHKVILTPAGKNFLAHARQLVHLWNTTKSSCHLSHEEVQGNIIVGCHSSVALYSLSSFLPNLLAAHPKLSVQLKHDLSRKITEEIIHFDIDVGITVNPIRHPDLIINKLFTDKVTYWQAHSKSKKILDANRGTIICNPDLLQTQWLLKAMQKQNITDRILTSSSLEVIASLTMAGAGIGIIPTCVVNAFCPGKLQVLPNAPVYKDEVCLVYRHENRHIKSIQMMIAAIKSSIKENINLVI